jgi:hypothetical protein
MKEKDMEELTQKIQEKLGEENSALIADDIGLLLSDNKNVNKQEAEYQNQIKILKDQKEKLIETNGNLLQQISFGVEETQRKEEKEETPKKHFDFRSALDKNGNFIK